MIIKIIDHVSQAETTYNKVTQIAKHGDRCFKISMADDFYYVEYSPEDIIKIYPTDNIHKLSFHFIILMDFKTRVFNIETNDEAIIDSIIAYIRKDYFGKAIKIQDFMIGERE